MVIHLSQLQVPLPSAARSMLVSNPVNVLLASCSKADNGESPCFLDPVFRAASFSKALDLVTLVVGGGGDVGGGGLRTAVGDGRGDHGENPVDVALRAVPVFTTS